MLKKSTRRVLGFTVAALIASVAAAQPVPAAAPANGTLFGIVGCSLCVSALDQLDPAAGTETPIATLQGVDALTALVADPANHLLYASSSFGGGKGGPPPSSEMITIDSQSGSFAINSNPAVVPLDMAFDPLTHTLFGLTSAYNGQTFSTSIMRLNPTNWTGTLVATLPVQARGLTYDPASQTLFTESQDFLQFPVTGRLYAVKTQTGTVSTGTSLNPAVFNLVFDTTAGHLYGVADGAPRRFVQVDASTGSETLVGSIAFVDGYVASTTIDSASHTVFFVENQLETGYVFVSRIGTVNDQTGASTLSPTAAQQVNLIAFQPQAITPISIQADVSGALTSGAIDNFGVANSLLAKLSAAADARSRGQCPTAANVYASFVNDLNAQSGKHVAAATAAQLTAEAQFLIANCA